MSATVQASWVDVNQVKGMQVAALGNGTSVIIGFTPHTNMITVDPPGDEEGAKESHMLTSFVMLDPIEARRLAVELMKALETEPFEDVGLPSEISEML